MRSILAAILLCVSVFGCAPAFADIVRRVDAAAVAAGVPIHIARAVVRIESNYNPRVTGRAGEVGLMQIKHATARGIGYRGSRSSLYDVDVNLRWGMRYLRIALDRGGTGCAGVGLYQRGVYAKPRCTAYGRKVMR